MGNSKSLYSKQELLFYYLQRKQTNHVKDIIQKYPQLINTIIEKKTQHTPLMRSSHCSDIQTALFLIETGAKLDQTNQKGQTALIISIRRNNFYLAKCLIEVGSNPSIRSKQGLTALDHAILAGFYDIAYYLYNVMDEPEIKESQQYQIFAKKRSYRYVNYEQILKSLRNGIKPQQMDDFLTKKRTAKLIDPVLDPRQSWSQWIARVSKFKDAPRVQRNTLPQDLQPQNRLMGKIHHYVDKFASTHKSQKINLYPKYQSQKYNSKTKQNLVTTDPQFLSQA